MNLEAIRQFNRFYARLLGVFDRTYLGVDFSVTEVRIIGEIGRNPSLTAKKISEFLFIDKGYLSRILQKLEKQNIIVRVISETDSRERYLRLTQKGSALNSILEEKANQRIMQQIDGLDQSEYTELLSAMATIQKLLHKSVSDHEKGEEL